jgi:hypothetical protein
VVENVAVKDMIWTFPGTSKISGEAHGIEEILARAHTIASYKVKVEIVRTVYGFSGVWVILQHRREDGKILDEHLAAVFAFARRQDRAPRYTSFRRADGYIVLWLVRRSALYLL